MRPTPRSIGRSLSWALALQAFAILALAFSLAYAAAAFTLRQRQDTLMAEKRSMIRHLAVKAASEGEATSLRPLLDFLSGHEELGIALRSPDGRTLRAGLDELSPTPTKRIEFGIELPGAQARSLRATLFLDTADDERLLRRLGLFLALAALVASVLVSMGSAYWVRRATTPLHSVIRQLEQLSASKLNERLDTRGQPTELQALIEHFNLLLERISRAYRQLEAFNANVAHELNTPLALLISSCQLGLNAPRSNEALRDILAGNLEDLDRLASIVRDMLFLARADQGMRVASVSLISVRATVQDVLDFHEAALEEAELTTKVTGDAWLGADAGLLRRALSNLLSNAMQFAPRGSVLAVEISMQASDQCSLSLHNAGPTIQESDLQRIFEPFFQSAPSSRDGHHGLGLAIVDAIARMHGGSPFARTTPDGSIVGLLLPVEPRLKAAPGLSTVT